jgi:ribosome assembly protein 4
MLASSSKDKTVRIWHAVTNRCMYALNHHTECVTKVLWGGEGFIYSSSEDRTINVYNQKGQYQKTMKGHAHWVNCMHLNTSHILRKGCYDEKLIQYDDRDKMQEVALKKYEEVKRGGTEVLVTGSDDCSLYLWRPTVADKPIKRLMGHQKPVNHVSFLKSPRI